MTGGIIVKNKTYYAVMYVKQGKVKQKWVSTGLPERGNKKAASAILSAILEKYSERDSFDDIDFSEFKQRQQADSTDRSVLELYTNAELVAAELIEPTAISSDLETIVYPKTLVSDCVWDYIQRKKNGSRKLSPATLVNYEGNIYNHIKEFFDQKPCFVETFTEQDMKDYLAYEREVKHLGETSIKRQIEVLKPALRRAIYHEGLRDHLPMRERDPFYDLDPVRACKPTRHFYNQEKIRDLLNILENDSTKLEIYLAGFYGLRRSEILGINYKTDIDFNTKMINLQHSVLLINGKFVIKKTLKNNASEAAMPLTPDIEKMVLERIKRIENDKLIYKSGYDNNFDGFLCVNELGRMKNPDSLTQHFVKLLKKHNLPKICLHELRHSTASILVAKNKNLKEVQGWLRHADISTTMNMYTHLDVSQKIECARAMSDVFGFGKDLGDLDKLYSNEPQADSEKTRTQNLLLKMLEENPEKLLALLTEVQPKTTTSKAQNGKDFCM